MGCCAMTKGSLVYPTSFQQHLWVAVDEVVDLLRTHHEGGNNLAFVEFFAVSGDDSFFDKRQDTVGEHLGVYAYVLVVVKARQDGVRDGADAHLEACAVFDEFGTIASYGLLYLIGHGHVDGEQGRVVFHKIVDFADVDESVAMGARHVFVDDGDGELGTLHGSQRGINGRA